MLFYRRAASLYEIKRNFKTNHNLKFIRSKKTDGCGENDDGVCFPNKMDLHPIGNKLKMGKRIVWLDNMKDIIDGEVMKHLCSKGAWSLDENVLMGKNIFEN